MNERFSVVIVKLENQLTNKIEVKREKKCNCRFGFQIS